MAEDNTSPWKRWWERYQFPIYLILLCALVPTYGIIRDAGGFPNITPPNQSATGVYHGDSFSKKLDLDIKADGSIDVVEKRIYIFDDNFSASHNNTADTLHIKIPVAQKSKDPSATSPKFDLEKLTVQCEGEEEREIPQLPTDKYIVDIWAGWDPSNSAKLPDDIDYDWLMSLDAFYQESINSPKGYFDIYHKWNNKTCTVNIAYSQQKGVALYNNASVFYLENELLDSLFMTRFDATLHFPVPSGESVKDNVTIADYFDTKYVSRTIEDTNTITIHADTSGTNRANTMFYIAYPPSWYHTHNTSPSSFRGDYDYKDAGKGAFPQNETRFWVKKYGILIGIGLLLLLLYRLKYRSTFKEKYWRDVPDKDLHPAVVSRIWGRNRRKQKKKDIPVILMHLADIGAIRLIHETDRTGTPRYVLERASRTNADLTELDDEVLDLVFHGDESVPLQTVQKRLGSTTKLRNIRKKIGKLVDDQTDRIVSFKRFSWEESASLNIFFIGGAVINALGYFYIVIAGTLHTNIETSEPAAIFATFFVLCTLAGMSNYLFMREGLILRLIFWVMAIVAVRYSYVQYSDFLFWGLNGNMASFIGLGVVILFILLGFLTLRPPENVREIIAKSDALKRWLKDFTLLDEKPPSDVKVWGELMVYATAFDVADETLKQIDKALPAVSNDSVFEELISWVKKDDDTTAPFDLLVSVFSERNR